MSILQKDLEALVLATMYEYTRSHGSRMTVSGITHAIESSVTAARVELALGALTVDGYVYDNSGWYNDGPIEYSLTDSGYKHAESVAVLGDADEDQALLAIEKTLAPASDRAVGFGDNQVTKQELEVSIQKVEEIVKSSNSIEPDVAEDVGNGLSTWLILTKDAKSFAVNAFRLLVWERVKKAISSSIEDAFKLVLKGLLITMGTIIVGLVTGGG